MKIKNSHERKNHREGSHLRKARIFLVDDHPLIRDGIADCIRQEYDLTVCGQAGNAGEALAAVAQLKPDLVLVDISLPGRDGIDLIKDIKKHHQGVLVIVLSMHDESLYAERVLRAGARGYVSKSAPTEDLIRAIRRVLDGDIAVGKRVVTRVLSRMTPRTSADGVSPIDQLTDRELEVYRLVGEGCQRSEIASRLHLSVKTIEAHRAKIREKLGLRSVAELRKHAADFLLQEAALPTRT